jgi:hypothetical protein
MSRTIGTAAARCWALGTLSLLLSSAGCGGRPATFDVAYDPGRQSDDDPSEPSGDLQLRGLSGSVALLDPALHQVLMFTSPAKLELRGSRLPVGRDVAAFESSRARDRLFVLSRGVTPRYQASDEAPQLRVFDGGVAPQELAKYDLQDPYDKLEIDPAGDWLIVHGSEGLVSNPNELILVDLKQSDPERAKTSKTLDSYGGKPRRFVFTSALSVPGSTPHRLLIVQREKDLAVIDLNDLDVPEITVGLPQRAEAGSYASPLDVVYHDGIDGEVNAMLAVQLENDSNVFLLTLNAPLDSERSLSLDANLVDVGGVPSQLDFVQTRRDGGLRLAALVPSKKAAKLIEPASGNVQDVALPVGFTRIRRITSDVSESSGQDIALLYGEATNTIAFWQLGSTVGTPYRSIDAYDLGINVGQVFDVPSEQFADRKILAGASNAAARQFYVLDLSERKSFPLDALTDLTLNLSPRGEQLWAFHRGAKGFARLTFDPLQPSSLYAQEPIQFVHDFASELGETQRSTLALHLLPSHGHFSVAATLFDGDAPSTANTRFYSELELTGIP